MAHNHSKEHGHTHSTNANDVADTMAQPAAVTETPAIPMSVAVAPAPEAAPLSAAAAMPAPVSKNRDFSGLYTPLAIVVAGLFIGGGLFLGLSHGNAPAAAAAGATGAQAPAVAADIAKVKIDGEPYIGSANAPVVMAFWSDFQCPYCKAFETGGVPQITTPAALPPLVTQYVNAGKLKIVFKDFPFLGNDSITAGEYARSIWALYPSQYFAWRTAMYKAQDQEGDVGFGNAATIDTLIKNQFPQISDAAVRADVAKNKATYDAAMQADEQEGSSFGIQGTPGFIVGKTVIAGAEPLSAFTAAIDPLLK